jgi:hypothetical protein
MTLMLEGGNVTMGDSQRAGLAAMGWMRWDAMGWAMSLRMQDLNKPMGFQDSKTAF